MREGQPSYWRSKFCEVTRKPYVPAKTTRPRTVRKTQVCIAYNAGKRGLDRHCTQTNNEAPANAESERPKAGCSSIALPMTLGRRLASICNRVSTRSFGHIDFPCRQHARSGPRLNSLRMHSSSLRSQCNRQPFSNSRLRARLRTAAKRNVLRFRPRLHSGGWRRRALP